jgi:glycogen synthase
MQPQSELEALTAVQTVIVGFSALRFHRESQHHMLQQYIDLYGRHADKLFRRQSELIRTYDRHRRGNNQTINVNKYVHVNSVGQTVVDVANASADRDLEDQK